MIKVKGLVGGYSDNPIIRGLDFDIKKGEFFALLGPNGSGKTTLFNLITGRLPAQNGEIIISGKPLASLSKLEKAEKIAVLTQEANVAFDYTVEEIISLGRYPHQKGFFKRLSKADRQIIDEVMEVTKVKELRNAPLHTISGGEKQRVLLAKALVQDPKVLLLDEPTNHLDIKHSFQLLDLLKEWQHEKGLTIFAILHDINVASLYADRIGLLHQGKFLEIGDVNILRKEEQLEKVYEVKVKMQSHPTIPKPQILMTPSCLDNGQKTNFSNSYNVMQHPDYIHIKFKQPLRTLANSVIGDGIQWKQHFCNFHVDKNYLLVDPERYIQSRLREFNIPPEQSVGMITAVNLENKVILIKNVDDVQLMVIVTAGVGNAIDITNSKLPKTVSKLGTINTMVFINANLTDGALVNAYMSATEAKTKVLNDMKIIDNTSNTIATGTATDSLLIGATQQGDLKIYAGSGTMVGKTIGEAVYEATTKAVKNYLKT